MARTVKTIYNEILTEKSKYTSLNNLSDTRDTAIWRTIYYVVAVAISVFEQINDVFRAEIIELADTLPIGTRFWYATQMRNYQEGYKLVYNRELGKLEYPTIDEESKIVRGASCINESDTVVLKVNREVDGVLTNLSNTQAESCRYYINDFKLAGTITKLVSLPGDDLKIGVRVVINKNKINSLGQSVTDNSIYPVEVAISDFLYKFGTESFDDVFLLINLVDAIQEVDGITNVVVTQCEAKAHSGLNYINILNTELHEYITESGYLKLTEQTIIYV